MKVREVIPHIGPIPIVIPPKLFFDLPRDPVFPRGLTDSQSYVPIFANDANHCMRIRSAVKIVKMVKMGTYDWLSVNLRGNTGSRRRSKITPHSLLTSGIELCWTPLM